MPPGECRQTQHQYREAGRLRHTKHEMMQRVVGCIEGPEVLARWIERIDLRVESQRAQESSSMRVVIFAVAKRDGSRRGVDLLRKDMKIMSDVQRIDLQRSVIERAAVGRQHAGAAVSGSRPIRARSLLAVEFVAYDFECCYILR